jgi:AraC family transcriptional regulator
MVQIEIRTTPAGWVSWGASEAHRVRVHAGPPTRGACREHTFVYTRGDIDLVPPAEEDVWREEDPGRSIVLSLESALLRRAGDELGLSSVGLEPRHQFRDPQIEHLAWALETERAEDYPNGALYAESVGLALGIHLLRRYRAAPAPEPLPGLPAARLRKVTDYIDAHLGRDLSLAVLASQAGLSVSHLKTLFRRSTGLPVHQYVLRRRAWRARELLMRGELPVSEVALLAGFAHQSHMARWVRRVYGVNPSELRRSG